MPNYPSTALDQYERRTSRGQPNGYATLGPDGKVPAAQGGGGGGTGGGSGGSVGPAGPAGPAGAAWTPAQSASAPATANAGTIATGAITVSRVAPTGDITGVILAVGTIGGQQVVVINEGGFNITFATAPTSHVSIGSNCVISAQTHLQFVWDSVTGLWYPPTVGSVSTGGGGLGTFGTGTFGANTFGG